jgi:adenine-specific DNA glycosylase
MEELQTIPGIGHYTAGAIRNFAFGIPTPCIDTNIRRILHRVFIGPENPDGTWKTHDKELLKIATEVLDAALEYIPKEGCAFLEELNTGKGESVRGKPLGLPFTRDWHAALMDFGSLVQTKNNPKWDICPLTAKGIMKTTPTLWSKMMQQRANRLPLTASRSLEPGRLVGSTHIPNRIFRGRICSLQVYQKLLF